MDQQQMIAETNVFDNHMMEQSIFGSINAIEDPSADIYAAVIDNAALLPDDGDDIVPSDMIPVHKRKYHVMRKMHVNKKVNAKLVKQTRLLLQEEHALWLK